MSLVIVTEKLNIKIMKKTIFVRKTDLFKIEIDGDISEKDLETIITSQTDDGELLSDLCHITEKGVIVTKNKGNFTIDEIYSR